MFQGTTGAVLALFGGVALFLLGMELLADGLGKTAGNRVRALLARLSSNDAKGVGAGALASTLIHSGPATVVLLGYVNAGLLTLRQSIPMVFGANIGTTLSMQIVSLNIGKYCFAVLAAGLAIRRVARGETTKNASLVVIGFGLLFLGLETMKAGFAPLRDSPPLLHAMELLTASTGSAYLLAMLLAAGLTVLFQSSGVVVSLLFSLGAMGVITNFSQSVPFILGAHIGTCSMTLFGAVGATPQGWRMAWSHVLFNVAGAGLATAMLPVYDWLIPRTSGDMTRQIANFNTIKQVVTVLAMLPLAGLCVKLLERFGPRETGPGSEHSHLDPDLLSKPESAILAVVKEIGRQALIVNQMLRMSLDGLVSLDVGKFRAVRAREDSVDIIKHRINAYISNIAERNLSPRQTAMLQRLVLASSAVERVGDHVEDIGWLLRTKVHQDIWFEDDQMRRLLEMASLVGEMLETATQAIDPTRENSRQLAAAALGQRRKYKDLARAAKFAIEEWIAQGGDPTTALLYLRFLNTCDKIVSHLKSLARQESDETYSVLDSELDREEPLMRRPAGRPANHPVASTFREALDSFPLEEEEDDDIVVPQKPKKK